MTGKAREAWRAGKQNPPLVHLGVGRNGRQAWGSHWLMVNTCAIPTPGLCSWALRVPPELPPGSADYTVAPRGDRGGRSRVWSSQPREARREARVSKLGNPWVGGPPAPELPPLSACVTSLSEELKKVSALGGGKTGPLGHKAQGCTHTPWPSSRGSSVATSEEGHRPPARGSHFHRAVAGLAGRLADKC